MCALSTPRTIDPTRYLFHCDLIFFLSSSLLALATANALTPLLQAHLILPMLHSISVNIHTFSVSCKTTSALSFFLLSIAITHFTLATFHITACCNHLQLLRQCSQCVVSSSLLICKHANESQVTIALALVILIELTNFICWDRFGGGCETGNCRVNFTPYHMIACNTRQS